MGNTLKNSSFALDDHERQFISDMVDNGRFGNRTEVVRAGLRLLEDYENTRKLQRLRAEIVVGDADIERGRITEYCISEELFNDVVQGLG